MEYIQRDIEKELLEEDSNKLKKLSESLRSKLGAKQSTLDEKMVEYISKNDIDDFEIIRTLRKYNEFLKNN